MVQSISKTPVGIDTATAIAIDAFGHGTTIADLTELTEGWFNAAYVLTLDTGSRSVLKVAPPPHVAVLTYERDIMTTEVAALRLIRERTAVPVPRVLWSDTTCRRLPSALFVMEHCDGTLLSTLRPTLGLEQQQIVDGHLARYLREMNAITNSTFGLQSPMAPQFAAWSDAFLQMFDDALADGAASNVELPGGYDALRALAHENVEALDEVTEPCFVHWDLWDPNVFVDPDTLAVTGLIDFERALWGDPLMEGQFLTKLDDPTFMDAYGVAWVETAAAKRRRLLYDLYLFVIMAVEVAYRHYPTDDIERLARQQLASTLGRLGVATS